MIAAAVALLAPSAASALNPVSFSSTGSLAVPREYPGAATLPDGRVMVAGGHDGTKDLASAEIFDAAKNSISSAGIGSLGLAREEAVAAPLADGRVLVAGGYNGTQPVKQLKSAEILSVPSNSFKAKLNGMRVTFKVTDQGIASVTDTSTKVATTAKKGKKKPKLVKTTKKHGGPGKITVLVKLTALGNARLRQKGKLRIKVVYTPDGGVAATKKLTLRG